MFIIYMSINIFIYKDSNVYFILYPLSLFPFFLVPSAPQKNVDICAPRTSNPDTIRTPRVLARVNTSYN